jgi:hypothetical protein
LSITSMNVRGFRLGGACIRHRAVSKRQSAGSRKTCARRAAKTAEKC